MPAFFAGDGAVFLPVLVLHGNTLKSAGKAGSSGRETVIGEPALDLDYLRRHRVVITNYETVINYQHSFAKIPWSIVVTDEAQEYKTPSTKISHALKSLAPRFRIACTGTPVETRLFDVWNLFDFLQPGPLLGSASDFRNSFESGIPNPNGLNILRQRLKIGASDAFLLRREKAEVLDLPPKREHYLDCELSIEQARWHADLLHRRGQQGPESHPFSILHGLMRVTQHHRLMPKLQVVDPAQAIAECPKLKATVNCLRQIRMRDEKVLIFTRSIDMQQLLALCMEQEFRIQVEIVNGATVKRCTSRSGKNPKADIDEISTNTWVQDSNSFPRCRRNWFDINGGESRYSLWSMVESRKGVAGNRPSISHRPRSGGSRLLPYRSRARARVPHVRRKARCSASEAQATCSRFPGTNAHRGGHAKGTPEFSLRDRHGHTP